MPNESFRWEERRYDVSAILRDITSKAIEPICIEWPAEAVKAYFDLFLNPNVQLDRPPLPVDLRYSEKIDNERLRVPIVLVHVGDRGLVAYEEEDGEPHHVVADGNHRIACAASRGLGLLAFVLSRSESERYEEDAS